MAAVVGLVACGGSTPPPRSGASAPRGHATLVGVTKSSLSDSALEPAAADAAKTEDWPRAEELYRELARRQPRNAGAKRGLGIALVRQGRDNPEKNAEAISAFEASLRIEEDARTRLELAGAFGALGRFPSALPHLRRAVELAPREPAAWTQLAQALLKVEKPDGASEALRASASACPPCASDDAWNRTNEDVARAFHAKAIKQLGSGDASGAQKSADLAVALRPNLPETQLVVGKVARAQGNTKAAATAYRKAIQGLPDAKADAGATARLELATLLLSNGDGAAEATKLAEDVLAARGDDATALDTLGRACDATRDTNCARNAYGKLVKLSAGGAPTKEALAHARVRVKELKSRRH